MKKNRIIFWALSLLSAHSFLTPFGAEGTKPLRNLGGVRVIIEEIGPVLQGYGLSETKLKRTIEAEFRVNGIPVLPEARAGFPSFHLVVKGMPYRKIRAIIYNVTVELRQKVSLASDPGYFFMSPTWSRGVTGVVSEGDMAKVVTDTVQDLVEQFIHDDGLANHPDKT